MASRLLIVATMRSPRWLLLLATATIAATGCDGTEPAPSEAGGEQSDDGGGAIALRWALEVESAEDFILHNRMSLLVETPPKGEGVGELIATLDLEPATGFCRVIPDNRLDVVLDTPAVTAIECGLADNFDITRVVHDKKAGKLSVIRSFDNPSGEPENAKPDKTMATHAVDAGTSVTVTSAMFPEWVKTPNDPAAGFELTLRVTGSGVDDSGQLGTYDSCKDLDPATWTGGNDTPLFGLICTAGARVDQIGVVPLSEEEHDNDQLEVRRHSGGEAQSEASAIGTISIPRGARVFLDQVGEVD